MRIDSHHHFWNYDAEEYGWISESMSILQRDFGPPELRAVIEPAGVDGVISVQARQTVEETRWLLEIAEKTPEVWGVVGWAPLAGDEEELAKLLEELAANPLLKGMRHVVQDEPDDRFLLRNDFSHGVAMLRNYDLVYDILIFARQLPPAVAIVDRHPDQRFVLDHIAKPTLDPKKFDRDWSENIRQLAKRSNVACKFSGVVTEVTASNWTVDDIRPYWDVVVEAFGIDRLMFGSDWPVCLLRSRYDQWISVVESLTEQLSASEKEQFWSGTARHWYKLTPRQ